MERRLYETNVCAMGSPWYMQIKMRLHRYFVVIKSALLIVVALLTFCFIRAFCLEGQVRDCCRAEYRGSARWATWSDFPATVQQAVFGRIPDMNTYRGLVMRGLSPLVPPTSPIPSSAGGGGRAAR